MFDYETRKLQQFTTETVSLSLQGIDEIGTGIDGSGFTFGVVAYLNFTFSTENGTPFILEYEPPIRTPHTHHKCTI